MTGKSMFMDFGQARSVPRLPEMTEGNDIVTVVSRRRLWRAALGLL
jgi:hypothetical protein